MILTMSLASYYYRIFSVSLMNIAATNTNTYINYKVRHSISGVDGLIWIVDSADLDRLGESQEEMLKVINDDNLTPGLPILLFANKCDHPSGIISNKLGRVFLTESIFWSPTMSESMCKGLPSTLSAFF